ncbi:MAG: hypothetical protein K0Q70_22 [Rhodospirillales bacterium]|nr:hypothetical protein [Rhodospirillales bacterium]
MRRKFGFTAVFGGILTGFLAYPGPIAAQEADLSAVRRQIEALKSDYEGKIRDLEQRLAKTESNTAKIEAKTDKIAAAPPSKDGATNANAFNPSISAVLNGGYTHFGDDPAGRARIPGFVTPPESSLGKRGFSLSESELQFKANVDQALAAQLTLAVSGDNEVEVEEAFIESLSLPLGLTAKGGRFLSGIGYLNQKHAHDWEFIDAPLPYVAFLGNQYRDDGVQLRWLAPTDMFLEFGGELFRGDNFPGSNSSHGKGAYSSFVHFGDDIGASSSWQAGLSYLRTEARGRDLGVANDDGAEVFNGFDNLGIASLVYKWAPDGNPTERNLKLSGEYFFQRESGSFDGAPVNRDNDGWYLQGVYQFMPQWKAGLRYDRLAADSTIDPALVGTALDGRNGTPQRGSALLEYATSEFGRIRLQYSRDDSLVGEPNNIVRLQYTIILGPHAAHGF